MLGFLALLIVLWIVLAILGFVIKGLLWLAIVGIVLFLITTGIAMLRRRSASR